jgi:hypothetical protein
MSIVTDVAKIENISTSGYLANETLATSQYCVVVPAGASTGKVKVGLPSGQGVLPFGVVQNTPASGEVAEVMTQGITLVKANSTFNSGVELTIAATTGKVEAASAADYVIGIAREAAGAANQLVSMEIRFYQKNA